MLLALTCGELGHMVFDLDLPWHTVVKFNGEGGVTLNHRGCRGGRRGWGRGSVRVLGGDLMELWPRGFGVLEVLGGDLKVAGFTVVGKDSLWC